MLISFSLSHIFSKKFSLADECYIGINDNLGVLPCKKMYSLLLALFHSFATILNQSGLLLHLEVYAIVTFTIFSFFIPSIFLRSFPSVLLLLVFSLSNPLNNNRILIRKRIVQIYNKHLNYYNSIACMKYHPLVIVL